MTIKVEQEALLRVLEHPPSRSSSESPIGQEDFVVIDYQDVFRSGELSKSPTAAYVEKLRDPTEFFDDADTLSTTSLSAFSDDSEELERRVSFAEDLVTDEWDRPYTPKEEVSKLFYSTEDTARFRQEYRLERKLLNELSIDPETFPIDDELSALVATTGSHSSPSRHSISRVVVLHNDKLETFFPNDKIQPALDQDDQDFSFDNDSFWSGSLTWY